MQVPASTELIGSQPSGDEAADTWLHPDELTTVGPRRARRLPTVPSSVKRASGPLLLVVLWQVGVAVGVINERFLPPPTQVAGTAWDVMRSGELFEHILISLRRVGLGLALGVLIGAVLAFVAGLFKWGEYLVDSSVQVLRSIPIVALSPLFVVWFGLYERPKIAIISAAVVFPIYLNTFSGIRGIDTRLIEMAAVFEKRSVNVLRRIVLVGALPSFFIGLRLAATVSWLVLIFAEQINTSNGLGWFANDAVRSFKIDRLVVAVIAYGILGFVTDAVIRSLEGRVVTWRRTFAGR